MSAETHVNTLWLLSQDGMDATPLVLAAQGGHAEVGVEGSNL